MAELEIKFPITKEQTKSLKTGDTVYLSGEIITGRDKAVKRTKEMLERGENIPFNIVGETIFYVGPTFDKTGKISSAGPTTSKRMDGIIEPLLDNGVVAIIGKGDVAQSVKDAMVRNNAVYFAAIGGAGALSAKCISKYEILAFEEFGAEAVYKFTLDRLPAVVVFDKSGTNLYSK